MDQLSFIWPIYTIVKVLLILVDAALVFVIIFAALELFLARPKFSPDPRLPSRLGASKKHPVIDLSANWNSILNKSKNGGAGALQSAIIEADALVDSVLKKRGYSGDTFADRTSKLDPHKIRSLNGLWNAHKLRNEIVHTPGFTVSATEAAQALGGYQAFLQEIGALR
jgi:hypothetical protein